MKYLRRLVHILPKPLREALLAPYHFAIAYLGAIWYRFPSKELIVIGVTGTKGKSTTTEILYSLLSKAGHKTAVAGTIRFAIGDEEEPNLFKMTMPGRFFLQRFLRKAASKGATHAVIEMTSEGAKQFRHKGIELNALIFTNLSPEHIESHGSLEKYAEAKLSLGTHLIASKKRPRIIIANEDDAYGKRFLSLGADTILPFSPSKAAIAQTPSGTTFVYKHVAFALPLIGSFNAANALAAITCAEALGVPLETLQRALSTITLMPGRAERIDAGQPFTVIVDYAHTPDSLTAIYGAFPHRKICVLGNTGGGRDTWKRPVMGSIADTTCDVVFLTNEDPYDEDPAQILEEMARGFSKQKPHIVLDRREAIRKACTEARPGDTVIITGKGTDPYIMGPRGTKLPWSDARVAKEELALLEREA